MFTVTLFTVAKKKHKYPSTKEWITDKLKWHIHTIQGFPSGTSGKEPACQSRRHKRVRFEAWVGKMPQRRSWQPTPVFLPGKSHGHRSLVGYSPYGRKELDTTKATLHDACIHTIQS